MAAIARFGSVSLDAPDAGGLARVCADLLGGDAAFGSDDFWAVRIGPELWLSTQRAADDRPPEWPDGSVPQPERWRVLIDPAGHPFRISTPISQ